MTVEEIYDLIVLQKKEAITNGVGSYEEEWLKKFK